MADFVWEDEDDFFWINQDSKPFKPEYTEKKLLKVGLTVKAVTVADKKDLESNKEENVMITDLMGKLSF